MIHKPAWGDEIIASGQASLLHAKTGRKVAIYGRRGERRTHDIWNNNPKIASLDEDGEPLVSGPGARPYVKEKRDDRWIWRDWGCPIGEIYLSDEEREFGDKHNPYLVIEPNNAIEASANRAWGWGKWVELVRLLIRAGIRPVQLGPPGVRQVEGAELITTTGFRLACAVLAKARAAILPEGGLHHAAAALGVRAVVIFGGFISPKQIGYLTHTNLFTGGEPCGSRTFCQHCRESMNAITPKLVFSETMRIV